MVAKNTILKQTFILNNVEITSGFCLPDSSLGVHVKNH